MAAYRQAILRNPTSPHPYLNWAWALEGMSQLVEWAANNGDGTALSHDGQHLMIEGTKSGYAFLAVDLALCHTCSSGNPSGDA